MINGNGPEDDGERLLNFTVDIVVASLANPNVTLADMPSLIADIHNTLSGLSRPKTVTTKPAAVAHDRRATGEPEAIPTCLECGKPIRFLKGHLASVHRMKVSEYRRKHGLSVHYPLTAESASAALPIMDPNAAVTYDHVTCLVCGKQSQILNQHLKKQHNLTAEKYRARFGLPADYPIASEAFRQMASERAKGVAARRGPEYMAMLRERRMAKKAALEPGRDSQWNQALQASNEGATGKTREALVGR
jgi:predicted transcriptional regulator